MTIRRQTLLAIVPVFALLALLSNTVSFLLERRALRAGLLDHAGSLATAVAAYVPPNDLALIKGGRAGETRYSVISQKLDEGSSVRRIALWDAAEGKMLLSRPPETDLAPPPADWRARFSAEPFWVDDANLDHESVAAVIAYAPVRDTSHAIIGIVGVEISARQFLSDEESMRARHVRSAVLVTGLGFVVALVLAMIFSNDLRRLARATTSVGQGHYEPPPDGLLVEATELSHAFSVVDSAIGEMREKSGRALMVNEHFRTDDDLLAVHASLAGESVAVRRAGLEFAVAGAARAPGRFAVSGGTDTHAWIAFGRLTGPRTLETACQSDAAAREIAELLAALPVETALTRLAALFSVASATVLTWSAGGAELTRYDAANAAVRVTRVPSSPAAGFLIVHDLPASVGALAESYLQTIAPPDAMTAARDLARLAGEHAGTVVVLARVAM